MKFSPRSALLPALAVLVLLAPRWSAAATSPERPNIVLILADDLGWGSTTPYGATRVQTPSLDRLAREGRRFTQAYAPGSVCSPSRYGVITGRYFWRTAIKDGEVLPPDAPLHIEPGRLTIASLCKSQGYQTAMFGKWHLGLTAGNVTDWKKPLAPGPRQVGFDRYFGMAANLPAAPHGFVDDDELGEPFRSETTPAPKSAVTAEVGAARTTWKIEHVMETLTAQMTGWIEKQRDQPFLVYYAPNAVHEPVQPNPRFTGSPYGKYGDFIRELDWTVGRILETLDRLKLADNTLVIFTSDNGGVTEERFENSAVAMKAGLALNGSLRGGKHSEWEGGFREPFLVRWPGRVPAGTVSDQVICLTDLLATFAGVFKTPLPPGQAEDSFDVLRAFTEVKPGAPVRDHVILQAADATYAIRAGDWKLIERANPPPYASDRNKRTIEAAAKRQAAGPRQDELFNLREDPAETKDTRPAQLDRSATLRQILGEARNRGFTRPGAGQ